MNQTLLIALGALALYLVMRKPSGTGSTLGSTLGSTFKQDIDEAFSYWEAKYELPGIYGSYILKAIAQVESNFNPDAVGAKGERGMMQLMPGAIKDTGLSYTGTVDRQIQIAAAYLALIDERNPDPLFGVLGKIAAYNAGRNAVQGYGYAAKVQEAQRKYRTEK